MSDIVNEPINLNNLGKPLTEKVYSQFANQVRSALLDLWALGVDVPLRVKGTTSQIDSFTKTLHSEKRYMDSYMKNGLNDPKTMNSKYTLGKAVERFEKETGLLWPFKN
tara:strand:+ start:1972 stop:2298 length:327 start_codon:yes stop_codon:yes gene_type:complete